MRFPVEYRGREAGSVEVQEDARGLVFQADCKLCTQAVLRLYALHQNAPLRIGVMEPGEADTLRLTRSWTRETMRAAHLEHMPQRYYLEDGQPGCLPQDTQEPTPGAPACPQLENALDSGAVRWQPEGAGGWLTAPFVPGQAHPLAFALTACVVRREGEGYVAALYWPNP